MIFYVDKYSPIKPNMNLSRYKRTALYKITIRQPRKILAHSTRVMTASAKTKLLAERDNCRKNNE